MMDWLRARWLRSRVRWEHRKEFEATGVHDVRLKADRINYLDANKLSDAREWLYEEENQYQRRADFKSTLALVISMLAVLVSVYSAYGARNSERAWVSPATMRLSQKPAVGEELRFFLEYQNSGRQPAQDVFYQPDSYTYNREMRQDIAARASRHIDRCKGQLPGDNQLTIFPGKGTFEAYQVPKLFVTEAVTSGKEIILIDGCFVYRTLNEVHRTAFCFKYDAKNAHEDDNGRPVMNSCSHGHYAN